MKEQSLEKEKWEEIGPLVDRKGAASYRFYPTKAKLYGITYRFLVVRSDQMDGRKEKGIQTKLEKEQKRGRKGAHTFTGTVVREERPGKREKCGAPRKEKSRHPRSQSIVSN